MIRPIKNIQALPAKNNPDPNDLVLIIDKNDNDKAKLTPAFSAVETARQAELNVSDTGLIQIGPFEWRGTGFPSDNSGLTSAPVGSKYVDRAMTNGAVVWRKMAPGGPSDWRCVVGDTGWRKIASWTAGVQDATNQMGTINTTHFTLIGTSYMMLRRINEKVIFQVHSVVDALDHTVTGASALFDPVADWTGFALPNFGDKAVLTVRTTDLRFVEKLGANTFNIVSPPTFVTTSQNLRCARAEWTTTDSWPTTLPGVAM